MSLFASATRAALKRTFSPNLARQAQRSNIENKAWLDRYITPPNRPMTSGEYAFLQTAKVTAIATAATAYLGGFAYISFARPFSSARMAQLVSQMPPEDAKRLMEHENDPLHFMPRLH